ncbi:MULTISPECIES: peroxiredoxin-like family protein [unclassified Sphingomonas]|jgi:peroxiredoxin|uniref:peroxiredoxin-like family protein n=1 Tax=unclassified Sphingomonas TaxID=196159 RepID=UPI0008296ECE|nr:MULTISPECIES: peroxiredoxin-like family protein [unclassified Sphingomonas]MCH4894857.1 redoxin domain-containing protein [Sphingomonas sp. SFZ2018-12]
MAQPPTLRDKLVECSQTLEDWMPIYDAFVARLRGLGVGELAPRPGDRFVDFVLPDINGRFHSLDTMVANGPLVLSFNRGGWCPYCRSELATWRTHEADLAGLGARFVSIAAEVGGRAKVLGDILGPGALVLCDIDHGLALMAGLAFHCEADLRRRYLDCGLDLSEIYGTDNGLLPVPATFVLTPDKIVRYAFLDPDFRKRADPSDVLSVLAAL